MLPPLVVIVWDAGVMVTAGALAVQVEATLIVVVTALDVALVWPVAAAVTDVLFAPAVAPVLACTVIVTFVFAPGAIVTEPELRIDGTIKFTLVESESVKARLKEVFVHKEPVSLFLTLTV
jgi:hypothetical protein